MHPMAKGGYFPGGGLIPAQKGLVANKPTAVLMGETSGARPEIASPVSIMRDTFKSVLAQEAGGVANVGDVNVSINLTVRNLRDLRDLDKTNFDKTISEAIKEQVSRGIIKGITKVT